VFIRDVATLKSARVSGVISTFKQLPRRFKKFLLCVFIFSLGSLPIAILLLKTESAGLMIASIPLFYMFYNIPYAVFSIAAGKASDRIGGRIVIVAGYIILLAGYAILSFAHSTPFLVAAFLVLGFFPALTDGIQRSLGAQITSNELRGGAFGLLNAANGLGALVAGIGGGYLWQTYGPSAALLAASVAIIAGLMIFLSTFSAAPGESAKNLYN
jgi:MFS family permease